MPTAAEFFNPSGGNVTMKWLDELNKRAPDDLKLNIVHAVFWGSVVGTVFFLIIMWDEIRGFF
jgi:hypothetical protein